MDFLSEVEQLQLPAVISNRRITPYQFADTRTVDVAYTGQIQHNLLFPLREKVRDRIAQLAGFLPQGDLSMDVDDRDSFYFSRADFYAHDASVASG